MRKRWIQERRRDYYHRLARKEGYRSRAAYKLLQAVEKYRFIRRGNVVVDLGAAPGGWLQAARKLVGDGGYVLGVDVKPITPLGWSNVETIVADITGSDVLEEIKVRLPRKADVVISDLSPNISGVWSVDHARQIDLARTALKIAREILKPGGSFFVKVFQGELFNDYVAEFKKYFTKIRLFKPKASRPRSAEIYVLGMGFNPQKPLR